MQCDNEKGFSLIEVLAGVTIFMFGMLGVVALLTSSVRDNLFSGNLSEATMLATSKIEVLMSRDEDHADLVDTDGDGIGGIDDVDVPGAAAGADGMDVNQGKNSIYTVYWNIADDVPIVDCKQIKVFVAWSGRENSRQISMSANRTGAI